MKKDFSDINKIQINKMMNGLEQDPFLCLYNYCSDFHTREIQNNIDFIQRLVNQYYSEIKDKNDLSRIQMDDIFRKAKEIDSNYKIALKNLKDRFVQFDQCLNNLNKSFAATEHYNSMNGNKYLTGKNSIDFKDLLDYPIFRLLKSMVKNDFSNYKSGNEVYSDWLSSVQDFSSLYGGLYNIIQKVADYETVSMLLERYGFIPGAVELIKSAIDAVDKTISFGEIYANPNLKVTEKISSGVGLSASIANVGGKTMKVMTCSALEERTINQILVVDKNKKMWKISKKSAEKGTKIGTGLALFEVSAESVEGLIRQAGRSLEDGFQAKDIGEIGVATSVEGLTNIIKQVTFDVVNIDGEKATEYVMNKAENSIYVDKVRQADSEVEKIFLSGVGAVSIVKDCVEDGFEYVGDVAAEAGKKIADWTKDAWNFIRGKE